MSASTAEKGVLVCGLGRLGESCVAVLASFDVPLHVIEAREPIAVDTPELTASLGSLTIGDFRRADVLERAGIDACRAILLLASDERSNIAAALAARARHPDIRIVIRSAQRNLNELLEAHLGNFIALDPMQLAAPAFALAALGDETVGIFRLDERLMRVRRRVVGEGRSARGQLVGDLSGTRRRVLGCHPADGAARGFHDFAPDARVRPGDVLTTVELATEGMAGLADALVDRGAKTHASWVIPWRRALHALRRLWQMGTQTQKVALGVAGVLAALFGIGVLLYALQYPEIGLHDALNVATVLILGGYDNLFGQLHLPFPIPWWLHLFSVLLSIMGTIGIGVVYAFLTERIVSMRLQGNWRRKALPRAGHVVLLGAGRFVQEAAAFLERLRCPTVTVGAPSRDADGRGGTAQESLRETLEGARVATARSLIAATDDEVANLEVALTARRLSSRCGLVLRGDDASFSENVAKLVPGVRAIGMYALAAEAFVAAAFGERVRGLLHVGAQTVLVTEYQVEPGDTLQGRLLGEVSAGYDVVPVLLERHGGRAPEPFPSDDARLEPDDRLVVLATIDGLRDVEQGLMRPRSFRVRVEAAPSTDAAFEGAMALARVSGCEVATAQEAMRELPRTLDVTLYEPQAHRLVRELAKVRVAAHVERV